MLDMTSFDTLKCTSLSQDRQCKHYLLRLFACKSEHFTYLCSAYNGFLYTQYVLFKVNLWLW